MRLLRLSRHGRLQGLPRISIWRTSVGLRGHSGRRRERNLLHRIRHLLRRDRILLRSRPILRSVGLSHRNLNRRVLRDGRISYCRRICHALRSGRSLRHRRRPRWRHVLRWHREVRRATIRSLRIRLSRLRRWHRRIRSHVPHIRILMQPLSLIPLLPRYRFMLRTLWLHVRRLRRFRPIGHRFMGRLRYRGLRIHFGFPKRRRVCNGTGLPGLSRFHRHRVLMKVRLTGDGLCRRTIGRGDESAHGGMYGIRRLADFRRL